MESNDKTENENVEQKEVENIKIDEVVNSNKEEDKNEEIKKENENKDENVDPNFIFRKELINIIHTQEKILTATSTINEKFNVSNEITREQIGSFKANIDKYGNYLLMIKKELGIISDTMRKIKKIAKEHNKK